MRSADTRHRGPHPADVRLFAPEWVPVLRRAVGELSWLLTREYPSGAALKLVGDRYALTERQRWAVARAACADEARTRRAATLLPLAAVAGRPVAIDGFNLLITLEAALSGGVVLRGRDGALRDLSSIHGTYRSVLETDRAIALVAAALTPAAPRSVEWLFDQPVSNSGRLAARLRDYAAAHALPWTADVVMNPDRNLSASAAIVVSSDSAILDRAGAWLNLAAEVLAAEPPAGCWIWERNEGKRRDGPIIELLPLRYFFSQEISRKSVEKIQLSRFLNPSARKFYAASCVE